MNKSAIKKITYAKIREARDEANRVISEYNITEPPIDVEMLVHKLGATLAFFNDQDGTSGMLKRTEKKTIIAVNESHHKNRQRFTIAHEIGHLRCHSSNRDTFVDQSKRVNFRNERSGLAVDPEEMQANAFAASLLMPGSMVEKEAEKLVSSSKTIQIDELIESMANTFQVSSQAMEYRLKNLGIIDADYESF